MIAKKLQYCTKKRERTAYTLYTKLQKAQISKKLQVFGGRPGQQPKKWQKLLEKIHPLLQRDSL